MPTINDSEFGEIVIRRHHNASRTAISIAPDGRLRITTPARASLMSIKLLVKSSRLEIRELLGKHVNSKKYDKNQQIGKSHSLVIQSGPYSKVDLVGTKIIVSVAPDEDIVSPVFQQQIRQVIIKALRKEAKSYLPRRLKYLADNHGFDYKTVKLTHASSRWGSCSSQGTISLNIALMRLPHELIDYVLMHELCHTRQMNHSNLFWSELEAIDSDYKQHRRELKKYTPNI